MPKRPNPFGDCSPLQLKQHVGTKDIDMGVARDQNMKEIYAKTKQMLFSGSKKSFIHTDANENHIIQPFTPTTTEVPMDAELSPPPNDDSQMHITASGALTQERTAVAKQKSTWAALFNKKKGSTAGCCECCKNQAASKDRCGFCEKSVCSDCIRPCCSCEGSFCQLCSVMNYDDITEKSFCLSCAS